MKVVIEYVVEYEMDIIHYCEIIKDMHVQTIQIQEVEIIHIQVREDE
jgi:hypothetical protein